MPRINQQIILARRPAGAPVADDFKLVTTPVPELQEGEVLLRTEYFTLDPYMRGRMSESKSYVPPFELNAVLEGQGVCIVEESKSPDLNVGERVLAQTGWEKYAIGKGKGLESNDPFNPETLIKIPNGVKPSYFLGALGMTGFTAYHGLMAIGQPKAGETVVVSAATGAVGSIVGQLAKLKGCRVVGIAGSAKKCQYAIQELGFDACVDHNSKTFVGDLKLACPDGIDIYYESVGGPVFWAVHPLLNNFARVPICGVISWYNDLMTLLQPGFNFRLLWAKAIAFFRVFFRIDKSSLILANFISKRLIFQGFIISDHYDHYSEFVKEVLPLIESGKIKVKEDIVQGIENAPEAFIGLLKGKNFGKLLIEVPQ